MKILSTKKLLIQAAAATAMAIGATGAQAGTNCPGLDCNSMASTAASTAGAGVLAGGASYCPTLIAPAAVAGCFAGVAAGAAAAAAAAYYGAYSACNQIVC
jgi:hypothetical protein